MFMTLSRVLVIATAMFLDFEAEMKILSRLMAKSPTKEAILKFIVEIWRGKIGETGLKSSESRWDFGCVEIMKQMCPAKAMMWLFQSSQQHALFFICIHVSQSHVTDTLLIIINLIEKAISTEKFLLLLFWRELKESITQRTNLRSRSFTKFQNDTIIPSTQGYWCELDKKSTHSVSHSCIHACIMHACKNYYCKDIISYLLVALQIPNQ